jgi:synaptobrevin family protein YKT6|eukprot:TRINITY_DN56587_c0_g1_i1.p1 TRINITY_DN56587_c0_g1~~TRINITY_DN56587_c0_g1_i1.p1  ORF type:complete len:201 (+),score=21.52 TRINITY_DN56587_c0_g1_i1:91-693(+)
MKLVSLVVYKRVEDSCVELCANYDLSHFSFFHRGPLKEHIRFHSRLCAARTEMGKRMEVGFDQNLGKCHTWAHPEGIIVSVLVDGEYPSRVACSLLSETVRIFGETMAGQWEDASQDLDLQSADILQLFQKFQNPAEADKLTKIEKDLEEVKETVMKSMDELLKRGESLDTLMQKSKDLSNTSVQFYRTAKKNNQCCKLY